MAAMLRVINLEDGMPSLEQARSAMLDELRRGREAGVTGLKLIHGYGSSGVGGTLRLGLGATLTQQQKAGQIQRVIFGENWRVSDPDTWAVLQKYSALKQDRDLGRGNKGITLVFF